MKFSKDNKIVYGQDFTWHSGVPDNIDFEIEKIEDNRVWLVADGYGRMGGNKYGNGSICVYLQDEKYYKYLSKLPDKKPKNSDGKIIKRLEEILKLIKETS